MHTYWPRNVHGLGIFVEKNIAECSADDCSTWSHRYWQVVFVDVLNPGCIMIFMAYPTRCFTTIVPFPNLSIFDKLHPRRVGLDSLSLLSHWLVIFLVVFYVNISIYFSIMFVLLCDYFSSLLAVVTEILISCEYNTCSMGVEFHLTSGRTPHLTAWVWPGLITTWISMATPWYIWLYIFILNTCSMWLTTPLPIWGPGGHLEVSMNPPIFCTPRLLL